MFAYNTKTGEAKSGAAAAAAEVNKYFFTFAYLHHIPGITAGTFHVQAYFLLKQLFTIKLPKLQQ